MHEGNYSGSNLVTAFPELLHGLDESFIFQVTYNPARGTANIEEDSEGIHANNEFLVLSDFGIMNLMSNTDSGYPRRNTDGTIKAVDINNPQSIDGVLRKKDTDDSSSSVFRRLQITNHTRVRGESTIIERNTCTFIIRLPNT